MQLAHEATKCEEKEEKLVKDAVQHLTQANIQIKDLHHQFTHKVSTFMHPGILWGSLNYLKTGFYKVKLAVL